MLEALSEDRVFRTLLAAAALVVIIGGLRSVSSVVDPILISGVVVACAAPLQHRLRRRGLSRGMAMTVTVLGILVGLVAFLLLIGYAATALVETVPRYSDRLSTLVRNTLGWLDGFGVHASESDVAKMLSPARAIGLATSAAEGLISALSQTLLIVFLSIFLLVDTSVFWRHARRAKRGAVLSSRWERRVTRVAFDVQEYVWITLLTGAMFAAVIYVVLMVLGVDLAALWAILALILSFIPGVGFIMSMLPPTVLALLEFGPERAAIVAVAFIVFNNVVDNVIKPRFMQEGFDLGLFEMFAAVLFWGFVLGTTGALLAIPLTLAVRRLFLTPDDEESSQAIDEEPAVAA